MTGLVEKKSDEIVTYIHTWLLKVHDTTYKEVHRIYNLQQTTPDFWENCKVFFTKPQLPEHKSIVAAGIKFRDDWRDFKANLQLMLKKEREANGTESITGEEGAGSDNKGRPDSVPDTAGLGSEGDTRESVPERIT